MLVRVTNKAVHVNGNELQVCLTTMTSDINSCSHPAKQIHRTVHSVQDSLTCMKPLHDG